MTSDQSAKLYSARDKALWVRRLLLEAGFTPEKNAALFQTFDDFHVQLNSFPAGPRVMQVLAE